MNTTQLIYRVLSGEATEEEKLMLEQWKASNDLNQVEFEEIKILWECSQGAELGDFAEAGYLQNWQQIKQKMFARQKRRKRIRVIISIAIVFLALGIVGWLAYSRGKQDKPSIHTTLLFETQ